MTNNFFDSNLGHYLPKWSTWTTFLDSNFGFSKNLFTKEAPTGPQSGESLAASIAFLKDNRNSLFFAHVAFFILFAGFTRMSTGQLIIAVPAASCLTVAKVPKTLTTFVNIGTLVALVQATLSAIEKTQKMAPRMPDLSYLGPFWGLAQQPHKLTSPGSSTVTGNMVQYTRKKTDKAQQPHHGSDLNPHIDSTGNKYEQSLQGGLNELQNPDEKKTQQMLQTAWDTQIQNPKTNQNAGLTDENYEQLLQKAWKKAQQPTAGPDLDNPDLGNSEKNKEAMQFVVNKIEQDQVRKPESPGSSTVTENAPQHTGKEAGSLGSNNNLSVGDEKVVLNKPQEEKTLQNVWVALSSKKRKKLLKPLFLKISKL